MNALPQVLKIGNVEYTKQHLDLIWRTAAKDCNSDEFSQFIHTAGHLNLDPLRKQIYAFVFSKDDAKKRQMSIIIGIDGFRTVARRSGDYKPDANLPRFTFDEKLIGPTNPQGIVSCTVATDFFSHGSWHPVPHSVEWEAYAPITDGGSWQDDPQGGTYTDKNGKDRIRRVFVKSGEQSLDPNKKRWIIDPKGMLAKCAEAGSIRKAHPDTFSGVYEQSEIDKSHTIDLSAAEYAEAGAVERRLELIGGKDTILFDFIDDRDLHPVPLGKIHDECMAFLDKHKDNPDAIETWKERNRHQLKDFWARAKPDALDVNKRIEAILGRQQ